MHLWHYLLPPYFNPRSREGSDVSEVLYQLKKNFERDKQ